MVFREAGKEGRSASAWGSFLLCAAAVFAGLFYVSRVVHVQVEPNFWWYNFCGALWGMGVVIPGMTSSSVMMALGLYQPMREEGETRERFWLVRGSTGPYWRGWRGWTFWSSPPPCRGCF